MRGIATIDRQPDSDTIAVWVTSRTALEARNVNAVVVDTVGDAEAVEKVRSLTRCCVVLATDGSTLDGLPIEGDVLRSADLDGLLAEVAGHQERILAAVHDFKHRSKSNASEPTFQTPPKAEDFAPKEDSASGRAFSLANFAGRVWTSWLKTDEERRRRTVQPKTGLTPWVMPEEMNAETVPDFPSEFAARLHEQPLV